MSATERPALVPALHDSSNASGSSLARQSLSELRRRLRVALDGEAAEELEALAAALATDTRAGARQLAERARRTLEARAAERERLAALFELRGDLLKRGARFVAGVDEVGVGPLAGPVVAGAVILPECVELPKLNDSKRLVPEAREELDRAIRDQAIAIGIGEVEPAEIDRLNIYHASLEAMRRAVSALSPAPDHLLVDARTVPGVSIPQTPLIHGDAIDGSIAAASIVAKVHRDRIMSRLDERYPGYGFGRHMGDGTAFHVDALQRLGASKAHRRSFAPVAAVMGPSPGP